MKNKILQVTLFVKNNLVPYLTGKTGFIAVFTLFGLLPSNMIKISPQNVPIDNVNTRIIISTDKPFPIEYAQQQVQIVVGESNFEYKIRVEKEKIAREEAQKIASREVVSRATNDRVEAPSFDEKRTIVKTIAGKYNIDWKILEAVWEVESGKSWDRDVKSYAGAQGPMQFLPSTFRAYAEPGSNINSAMDSLHAGAKYLAANGADRGEIDRALFAYNHSTSYVAKVKGIAYSIR